MPYSLTHDAVMYGVFINHGEYSNPYINDIAVVSVLRQPKFAHFMFHMIDWNEWSIDSIFIRFYAEQLVLVMGTNDNMIRIRDGPVLNECQVIYTDTRHGMVIFNNFMSQIELWNNCRG